jgi:hypothetical protein
MAEENIKTENKEEQASDENEKKSDDLKSTAKNLLSTIADKAKSIDYANLGDQIKTKVGANAVTPEQDVVKRSEASDEVVSKAKTSAKEGMLETLSNEAETVLEDLIGNEKIIFKFRAGADLALTEKTLFIIKASNVEMVSVKNIVALKINPPIGKDGGGIKIIAKSGYSIVVGIGSLECYFKMTELLKKIRQS